MAGSAKSYRIIAEKLIYTQPVLSAFQNVPHKNLHVQIDHLYEDFNGCDSRDRNMHWDLNWETYLQP